MLLYHMHDRSSFISPLCIVAVSGRVLKTSRNRGELERGGGVWLFTDKSNYKTWYRFFISTTWTTILFLFLISRVVFIFEGMRDMAHADVFALPKTCSSWHCVCAKKQTPVDKKKKRKRKEDNEYLGLSLFVLEHKRNKSVGTLIIYFVSFTQQKLQIVIHLLPFNTRTSISQPSHSRSS